MTFPIQPAPTATVPAQPVPRGIRTDPAKPELNLRTPETIRQQEPLTLLEQPAPLPSEVQTQVNIIRTALQSAGTAYNTLATGYLSIWESEQYPQEYRQGKAAEFMDAVFGKQAADLQRAEDALKAARLAVRAGLVPPLLGDSTTHELKLMNAREEVRMALDGLGASDQLDALEALFDEALDGGQAGIAYLIGGTDSYKRLLRDPATRLMFAQVQPDMLKRLLPPTAEGYLRAVPVLDELDRALEQAVAVRVFTAKDNGLELPAEVRL